MQHGVTPLAEAIDAVSSPYQWWLDLILPYSKLHLSSAEIASEFDIARVRTRFPALNAEQVFLDNAGLF
jgi:hypothetical protein